ncbi:hypothetical protein EA187_18965 [Lujinxingia sediminis]|uniref:Uncharacterized protein n=1 Tax=Lujinxingia sediminis TaxID=2480984 RepID=A0ABY0CN90_9DELT|nr:hypothetical protein EA187_18965 [Lujinxingia sediminis]
MVYTALLQTKHVDIDIGKSCRTKKNLPHATTLDVRDHCLCLAARRAGRALARRFDLAILAEL